MNSLSIPRSLFWILLSGLMLLVLMSLYRVITTSLFAENFSPASYGSVILLGIRYDARYIAIFLLPAFAFSLVNSLHPFKTRNGRKIILFYFTIICLVTMLVYGCDLASQIAFRKRLTLGIIKEVIRGTERSKMFTANAPWVIIFLISGVCTWLYYIYLRSMHSSLMRSRPNRNKFLRIFWQVMFVLFAVIAIYGRPMPPPLSGKRAKALKNEFAAAAALNPYESVRLARNKKN